MAHNLPKNIKNTTTVMKRRNTKTYPITMWYLSIGRESFSLLASKIWIMYYPWVHESIMCMICNTYLVISEKGMYFARKVFDRVAISRRHMVRGIRAIWKRIACIVPNSNVGTPTFQLRNGAAAGTLVSWELNFDREKWAIIVQKKRSVC